MHNAREQCHLLSTASANCVSCAHTAQIENPGIGLPSIEAHTVAQLLTGHHSWDGIGRAILIDCRYEYEHAGGCITGAVNMQVCFSWTPVPRSIPGAVWRSRR